MTEVNVCSSNSTTGEALQEDPSSSLPQEPCFGDYSIYRHEEVESKFLSTAASSSSLAPDTLCWVLLSKGRKRNKASQDSEGEQRKQLLSRAWIVGSSSSEQQQDGRILVRYPKGSTYRVKRENLLPVLMHSSLIVVLAETNLYRRFAVVHTRPNDAFTEIGCDVGILVHRIWEHSTCPQYVSGMDKAPEDIAQAQQRYPNCKFVTWNVPLLQTSQEQDTTSTDNHNPPLPMDLFPQSRKELVVAIDINGNRELEAVQHCIRIVIQEWKPRLIIVKSRELYAQLGGSHKRQDKTDS
ncbi:expressed unknown protein [Seminavis robusta]|uniref:Methyltransferase n=1 Tax=Seminavis robusta TaxID=568900 RepID=A0A9N8HB60_9STRA|nr:expressed unknown protein [Seminavis robusta]|eukprot:Sro266_g103060.1 n/a (296) ;mRNA; r:21487-22374